MFGLPHAWWARTTRGIIPAKEYDDALAGLAHGGEHGAAGVDVLATPHGVLAGALSADIEAGFDLFFAGSVNAEGGLGDAGRGVARVPQDVEALADGGRVRLNDMG